MAEVNLTSFYKFLSGYDNWKETCDTDFGNKDGVVIKKEFKDFAKAEWNGEETLTDDLINKFWAKIDTQTSGKIQNDNGKKLSDGNALNDRELKNLDDRLEAYQELDTFLDENVLKSVPNFLGSYSSKWKNDITVELSKVVEKYIAGGGNLNDMLADAMPAIYNKTTAEYAAVAYLESSALSNVLKKYPDYKIADDATLNKLIDSRLKEMIEADGDGVVEKIDADVINDEIQALIDAYLATAGLGEGNKNGADFDKNTPVTDLQKAVLKQNAKENMAELRSKNKGYETQFDEALEKYIDKIASEGNAVDFEDMKNKMSQTDFKDSKEYKNFNNFVTIDEKYANFSKNTSWLDASLPEAVIKLLKSDAKYVKAYQNIIAEVKAKVEAGEYIKENGTLDKEGIQEYINNQIMLHLDEILSGDLSDSPVADIYTVYKKLTDSADMQTDPDEGLKQHREAAIRYCDAIAKKGNEFKTAIENEFGTSDYRSAINKMMPSELKGKIDSIKKAIEEFTSVDELTGSFTVDNNNSSINIGETYTTKISPSFTKKEDGTNKTKTVQSYRAVVVAGSADVDIDANGQLTVTGNKAGTVEIAIYAIVDGKEIKLKGTVKVEVESTKTYTTDTNGTKTVTSNTLNNATGTWTSSQCDDTKNTNKVGTIRTEAKDYISYYVDTLAAGCINESFNKDAVEYAKTTTKNYFNALLDKIGDNGKGGNDDYDVETVVTFKDSKGNDQTALGSYHYDQANSDTEGKTNSENTIKAAGGTSIAYVEHDRGGDNHAWIMVSNADIAEVFKKYLIQALS